MRAEACVFYYHLCADYSKKVFIKWYEPDDIENGRLTGRVLGNIIGATGKGEILGRIRDQLGLSREQVIAIGDGANDLRMLDAAGIGIAFHAKPVLRKHATYCLDHVGLDGVLNLFE